MLLASGESSQLCRGARSPDTSLQSSGRGRDPSQRWQGGLADRLVGPVRGVRHSLQPKRRPDEPGCRGRRNLNLTKQDSKGKEREASHDQRTHWKRPGEMLSSHKADQGSTDWLARAKAPKGSAIEEGSSQWHKGPGHLARLDGYVASAVSGRATAVHISTGVIWWQSRRTSMV